MSRETAAFYAHVLSTSYNYALVYNVFRSHTPKVHVCLSVTCHLKEVGVTQEGRGGLTEEGRWTDTGRKGGLTQEGMRNDTGMGGGGMGMAASTPRLQQQGHFVPVLQRGSSDHNVTED